MTEEMWESEMISAVNRNHARAIAERTAKTLREPQRDVPTWACILGCIILAAGAAACIIYCL